MKSPLPLAILMLIAFPSVVSAQKMIGPQEAIKRAKEKVASDFKDPASLQWKNVYFNQKPDGTAIVCGQVNGKNSYGGYVGFRGFLAQVSLEKDYGAALLADAERMQAQAQANRDNVGKGLPEESDVFIDPGNTTRFFEAFQKNCVDGKRTYAK